MHRAIANALKHPLRSVRKTAKFSASKRPQRLESNRCHLRRFSSTMSKDPFVVLQLQRPTQNSPISEDDVKAAFRKAAIRTHPDQGGTAAAFREATDAYEECLRVVLSRYGRQVCVFAKLCARLAIVVLILHPVLSRVSLPPPTSALQRRTEAATTSNGHTQWTC